MRPGEGARAAGPDTVEWPRRIRAAGSAALVLMLATALLHHSALSGGWMYDDPPQLRFAVTHAPWQYFFVPEAMRMQSYAHITPFNTLFYDIGLPLFGLDATGHYVHMLMVLWLASLATWFLLRPYVGSAMALAGALLLLAMPPTGVVAHLLMTGHYAYGLLFSVLALAAFARAVRSGSAAWALAAAGWYALACLCKELYVPLLLVFLAWPGLAWPQRLRLTAAPSLVGAAYAAWRLHVLDGVGGYGALAGGSTTLQISGDTLLHGMQALQAAVFGSGWPGWLALSLVVGVVLASTVSGRKPPPLPLVIAALAVLLAPVLPLLLFDLPYGLGRVAIAIGFGVVVLFVWGLARLRVTERWRRPVQFGASAALIALQAVGQHQAAASAVIGQRPVVIANDFLIHADADETLFVEGLSSINYVLSLREVVSIVEGRRAPAVIENEDELIALGPARGAASWTWQPACECLQRMGDGYAKRVAAARAREAAGAAMDLSVHMRVEDRGRVKTYRWNLGGSPGTHRVEVRHLLQGDMGPIGALAVGIDTTFDPPEPALLRFSVIGGDGGVKRSPWLPLSLSKAGDVRWNSREDARPDDRSAPRPGPVHQSEYR